MLFNLFYAFVYTLKYHHISVIAPSVGSVVSVMLSRLGVLHSDISWCMYLYPTIQRDARDLCTTGSQPGQLVHMEIDNGYFIMICWVMGSVCLYPAILDVCKAA